MYMKKQMVTGNSGELPGIVCRGWERIYRKVAGAVKKMLKMKVDPIMSLKTNGEIILI
jgi:hypothetical protein